MIRTPGALEPHPTRPRATNRDPCHGRYSPQTNEHCSDRTCVRLDRSGRKTHGGWRQGFGISSGSTPRCARGSTGRCRSDSSKRCRALSSVALALNPATIANLLLDRSAGDRGAADLPGLKVSECTTELLDAVARLLRLLDRQDDVAVLQPMLEREILWRLLAGVGYDSPSQFSREYRRLFGVPPGEDIKGMRTDSRQERSLA